MTNAARVAIAACLALATATLGAQQTAAPGQGGGRGQGAGRGGGRGQQQGPAPGALPATEQRVPPACATPPCPQAPSPPLGIPIESAVPAHRNLRAVIVAAGLVQPWSIAFLPDGNMLVTERPGRLRVIRNGNLDPNPVSGVPAVRAAGLQGLMDVVLHPRFA